MLGSTKEPRSNRRLLWSGTPDCPVCHRTVSGALGNSKPNSSPSGIFRGASLYFTGLPGVHRIVSGAPRKSDSELASFGNPLRYNSPDCPVSQWSNGYFAPTVTCRSIKCVPERTEVRHARSGAPDTLQYMSGVPPDI